MTFSRILMDYLNALDMRQLEVIDSEIAELDVYQYELKLVNYIIDTAHNGTIKS